MNITHIVFDLDGVLTDGRQHIDEQGQKIFKSVHCRDKTALRRLIESGYSVTVITMDDWPGAIKWFEEIGCSVVYARRKETIDLPWASCLGVGDDLSDIGFLMKCAVSFCPDDAHKGLTQIVDFITDKKGGSGIVEEIEAFLLEQMTCQGDRVNYILKNCKQ